MQHSNISPHKTSARGFTLIETLVAIFITSTVLVTLLGGITYFYRTNSYVLEQAQAVDNARRGIEFSVRDLREATYGDDGSYPIQSADTNEIIFFSALGAQNSVAKVRYYLQGTTFYRGVTYATGTPLSYVGQPEHTHVIASHVRNTDFNSGIFQYVDRDGETLTAPINVARLSFVTMSVIVNINPNRAPEEFTLTGSAMLRNLRYE